MRKLLAIAVLTLVAAPSAAAKLPLRPCTLGGTSGLCGRLAVPENRAEPAGRKISLRVMVLRSTIARARPDPVFVLAGGPGGAATGLAGVWRTSFASVNADRDVVLVDQRGTGGSNPLTCPLPKGEVDGAVWAKGCLASFGAADLSQYGSTAAADDVDAVRQALGYGKIDLYGASYGATLAQVYLNRHPETVRAVVLDGGTLLDVPIFERFGSNGQRALDEIARRCAADSRCRAAFPTWSADLPGLLAGLRAAPRAVAVGTDSITLDARTAAGAIHWLTLGAEGAAQVPYVVAHAVRGDLDPLARAALASGETGDYRVLTPLIECSEPWARADPAAAAADARGTYMEDVVAAMAENTGSCGLLPKLPVSAADTTRPHGNVPLLAILGSADPQDPIGNIAGIRETMPRARIVVANGQGHTVGTLGCMPALVASFLARGSASGLATGCARSVPTPSFRTAG